MNPSTETEVTPEMILDAIRRSGNGMSFIELERILPQIRGDCSIVAANDIIIWNGVKPGLAEVIQAGHDRGLFHLSPSDILVYLFDGQLPNFPVAKINRRYKTPHWMPMTFVIGACKIKNCPRCKLIKN